MPYCTTEMLVFLSHTVLPLLNSTFPFVNEKKEYNFVIRISVENGTMQLT